MHGASSLGRRAPTTTQRAALSPSAWMASATALNPLGNFCGLAICRPCFSSLLDVVAHPSALVVYLLLFPLAAPIHATVPTKPDAFARTLLLALAWLVLLATLMAECLDAIGCVIGFSSTVMGLTLGAAGTSFPNQYASV